MVAGIAHKWGLGWFITNIGYEVLAMLCWICVVAVTTSFIALTVLVGTTYIALSASFIVPAKPALTPIRIGGFNTP
jgi:hypothetical protein